MILAEYLPEETDPRYQNYNYVATELSIIRYGADDSPVLREYIALMLLRAYQNQQYALWTINNNEAFALSNKDDY
ncbi:MAG: hypothetical protein H6766_07320 [Candidatus Peribacteria bacterium]|nr:MAG: hypothetical protein H6766_07320 [Candidatus Peribacteria bacterium]